MAMIKLIEPTIGKWYRNTRSKINFEVVSFEPEEGSIEIQHFDGDIEEIDIETWYELDIDPISAPEDWTGPYEMESDDLGFSEPPFRQAAGDWSESLSGSEFDDNDL